MQNNQCKNKFYIVLHSLLQWIYIHSSFKLIQDEANFLGYARKTWEYTFIFMTHAKQCKICFCIDCFAHFIINDAIIIFWDDKCKTIIDKSSNNCLVMMSSVHQNISKYVKYFSYLFFLGYFIVRMTISPNNTKTYQNNHPMICLYMLCTTFS